MGRNNETNRRWPVTILLVEDDLELASAVRQAMADRGCLVHLAQDGSEALEALGRMRPDAIVLDAVMAGMDGMEAPQALKAERRHREIPVIVFSGSGEYQGWALRSGSGAFLLKPVSGAVMHHKVQRCLNRTPQNAKRVGWTDMGNRVRQRHWCRPLNSKAGGFVGSANQD